MRRAIEIKLKDGTSRFLELSKAVALKSGSIHMMHLDKLQNDTWRLTFSDSIAEDFSQIVSFNMIRED